MPKNNGVAHWKRYKRKDVFVKHIYSNEVLIYCTQSEWSHRSGGTKRKSVGEAIDAAESPDIARPESDGTRKKKNTDELYYRGSDAIVNLDEELLEDEDDCLHQHLVTREIGIKCFLNVPKACLTSKLLYNTRARKGPVI